MRDSFPPPDISRANAARIYDYWLDGKDHYAADRIAAERILDLYPDIRAAAWENRMFHQRAALWMARCGISQFIDVGCGLPTAGNTHQAVRQQIPDARVVYADSDPVVVSHARALLAKGMEGVIALLADARAPEMLLRDPAVRGLLDWDKPAGLLMTAVLHFVEDAYDPADIMRRYAQEVPAGSAVAISHATADHLDQETAAGGTQVYAESQHPIYLRTREQVRALLGGLDPVPPWDGAEPDVVPPRDWLGPETPGPISSGESQAGTVLWCAVGVKPR